MINLMIHLGSQSWDVSGLVPTVEWSGDYQSCARKLEFEMLANGAGDLIPQIPCDIGSRVAFREDGNLVFDGYIFSRQKSTESSRISVTCYDRGLYLKRNEKQYQFVNQKPDAIVRRICTDFGISEGNLASVDVSITRNFTGNNLYQIIMTAYTLAAEQTGKNYFCLFRGDRLCVEERTVTSNTLLLLGGSNLMSASCSESVENMVNRVEIYDSNGNFLKSVENAGLVDQYGVLQKTIKQSSDGEDMTKKAQKTLEENGYSQKITVESLGDIRCVTGGTVAVQEPYTGVCGLFWIDSDTHTWKNGLYFNKLTLNYKSVMDEQTAGSLPKSSRTGSDSTKQTRQMYHYVNPPKQKTETKGE